MTGDGPAMSTTGDRRETSQTRFSSCEHSAHGIHHTIAHDHCPEQNEERFELITRGASIAYANVIDRGHEMWIAELWVHPDHRTHGFGTCLLKALLSRHRLRPIALSPDPFEDGPDTDTLASWYARHGFRYRTRDSMVRSPEVLNRPATA
jgi:GNAT superfamily N-acetyltransferase